mmetsp:Transcript_19174/g.27297  ORF Transcript_19174/g.27297 Transcript_19174/m.27297 type:complete len:206 (+) Transcript_19174:442-1059(+)
MLLETQLVVWKMEGIVSFSEKLKNVQYVHAWHEIFLPPFVFVATNVETDCRLGCCCSKKKHLPQLVAIDPHRIRIVHKSPKYASNFVADPKELGLFEFECRNIDSLTHESTDQAIPEEEHDMPPTWGYSLLQKHHVLLLSYLAAPPLLLCNILLASTGEWISGMHPADVNCEWQVLTDSPVPLLSNSLEAIPLPHSKRISYASDL